MSSDVSKPTPEQPASSGEASGTFSRRNFLRSAAISGTALGMAGCSDPAGGFFLDRPATRTSRGSRKPGRDLQIALIGCGAQGQALWTAINRIQDNADIPHLRAIADIDPRPRMELLSSIRSAGHEVNEYENIEDLLAAEADNLDAILIATPDWVHHEHTILSLEAGLDVYCEKMMSNKVEYARAMVQAQRRTGKLLQIGHQRRSNPRYLALRDGIISKHHGLGQMTHAYAQWNRGVQSSLPQRVADDPRRAEMAQKYGYESLYEFRNWRNFKKYGGGIISDLGAHQIDLFNWFYEATPTRVVAMGGIDYWNEANPRGSYELPDNVMAMYEYETPAHLNPDGKPHTTRAYYQVLTTTSSQSFHERFMGDKATTVISEIPYFNQILRETHTEDRVRNPEPGSFDALVAKFQQSWEEMLDDNLIYKVPSDLHWHARRPWQSPQTHGLPPSPWVTTPKEEEEMQRTGTYVDVRVSEPPVSYELATSLNAPAHQPHLLNFFTAIEANDKSLLNCPGEVGFRTCATVLKIYEALEQGGTAEFSPEDFAI